MDESISSIQSSQNGPETPQVSRREALSKFFEYGAATAVGIGLGTTGMRAVEVARDSGEGLLGVEEVDVTWLRTNRTRIASVNLEFDKEIARYTSVYDASRVVFDKELMPASLEAALLTGRYELVVVDDLGYRSDQRVLSKSPEAAAVHVHNTGRKCIPLPWFVHADIEDMARSLEVGAKRIPRFAVSLVEQVGAEGVVPLFTAWGWGKSPFIDMRALDGPIASDHLQQKLAYLTYLEDYEHKEFRLERWQDFGVERLNLPKDYDNGNHRPLEPLDPVPTEPDPPAPPTRMYFGEEPRRA